MASAQANSGLRPLRIAHLALGLLFPLWLFYQYFLVPRSYEYGNVRSTAEIDAQVRLTDVTEHAGLKHVSSAVELAPELKKIPFVSKLAGFGVAVGDFDNDGWMDIYATSPRPGTPNHLYRNNHDGTFSDVSEAMGVAHVSDASLASNAALWVDVDGDGWLDLLVVGTGCPKLFRNAGGKKFVPIPFGTGGDAGFCGDTQGAIAFDYNLDGRPDIYLVNRALKDWRTVRDGDTRLLLPSYTDIQDGPANQLYENLGGGRFREVAGEAGVTNHHWSFAAIAGDFNNDGKPDLYVANESSKDLLYLNQGGKFSVQDSRKIFPGLRGRFGMGAEAVDLDGDGNFGLYVSKASHPGFAVGGNEYWSYDPATGTYENRAPELGIDACGWSWGAVFVDTELRGSYDLIVANGLEYGKVQGSPWSSPSFWFSAGSVFSSSSRFIEDARYWPPMKERNWSTSRMKCFFHNTGKGFVNIAPSVGFVAEENTRAIALVDIDNNGTQDILISAADRPLRLFRNEPVGDNRWIGFRLLLGPHRQDAVGARVTLTWRDESGAIRHRIQEVRDGNGFAAQSDPRLVFGLGHGEITEATVRWPGGKITKVQDLKTNAYHTLYAEEI